MEIVYIALRERVQVQNSEVCIEDVADVYSGSETLTEQIKKIPLFQFQSSGQKDTTKKEDRQKVYRGNRQIVTMLFLVRAVRAVEDDCVVLPTGQQDCVVERIAAKPPGKLWNAGKLVFVCLICLAGGAFSIMAFHNDISVTDIFTRFYEVITGRKSNGFTLLELSYSVGLAVGIIVFYNHVGKRRISKDPTPIEVSMRTYEQEMNQAMIESWEREGKKIDVR